VPDGYPAPLPKNGAQPPPQFLAHVHCGQRAGWINMALGREISLSPGDFVLDRDPAPSPKRGRSPLPNFRPILLWPNGWMHQDVTWYGCMPLPRGLCVRWRLSSPPQNRGGAPQIFGPCLLWPKGWMDQYGTWHGDKPQPRRLCFRWEPSPSLKRGWSPLANFRPIYIVAKRLGASG